MSFLFFIVLNASMNKYYYNPNEWYVLSYFVGFWINSVITTYIKVLKLLLKKEKKKIPTLLIKILLTWMYAILVADLATEIVYNRNDWTILFFVCGLLSKSYAIELKKILIFTNMK
jgi:hypothetical protein